MWCSKVHVKRCRQIISSGIDFRVGYEVIERNPFCFNGEEERKVFREQASPGIKCQLPSSNASPPEVPSTGTATTDSLEQKSWLRPKKLFLMVQRGLRTDA